jgi:hypothetical protein
MRLFCGKIYKSGIAEKILARASAGVDEKWVLKNQKCTNTGRKMLVLDSRENFGQVFRRGRREMGSKN